MSIAAPPIDARVAADIERQLVALLKTYAPGWNEFDPASGLPTGASAALTGIFSRFAEITLQRLNLAPDKNLLAFLDLLGATLLSPQPARAPLTFSLAARAPGATVPAATQIAAPPDPDQPKGVIFETERELTVTPATLARVINWDGPSDTLADFSPVAQPGNAAPATLFTSGKAAEHLFYIAQDEFFGFHDVQGFSVTIILAADIPAPFDARTVQWELWDGQTATPIVPSSAGVTPDDTANLTNSGQIWFMSLPQIPRATVAGVASRWLRCRLLTPITVSADPVPGFVRASQLPVITAIIMDGVGRSGDPVLPDAAFFNTVALDVSKDFYPFGADAKFGATWYIASRQVLSVSGRQTNIYLTLTDPATGVAKAGPATGLTLKWEYWTGADWTEIGTSTVSGGVGTTKIIFFEFSCAMTVTGAVIFVLDAPAQPTRVNGVEGYWLRVHIAGGGYQPVDATKPPVGPSLSGARLYYDNSNRAIAQMYPDALARSDGAETIPVKLPFAPFVPAADTGRSLYLGFAAPTASLAQAPLSLFMDLAPIPFGTTPDAAPDAASATVGPQLAWSYWDGHAWNGLSVADDTAALTLSETLQFLPPADLKPRALFASDGLLWLRAAWTAGSYKFLPRLRRALLNTVMAQQATTITGEILGSSSASASQSFTAAQTPIFDGVALDVIEDGVPVRWREVSDFFASGPRDRDFMLDHFAGTVQFGDGISGLVPPAGTANIRLSRYRSGVGAGGDAASASIAQLKTTVPYIASVTNWLAAAGGVAGETQASLRDRAPRQLRHGGRAVTVEDFQDLACLASPEVARALCVPLLDLSVDPDGTTPRPGTLSVIIVPNSAAAPPSVELVERTLAYLDAAALPTAAVVVVGPEYVTVSVHVVAGLVALDGAGAVQAALQDALAAFLHPLTGGTSNRGWDFGRRPHRSDLFRLLQAVVGVDHIATLTITETPDRAGTPNLLGTIATGRFLVCSGVHRVDLSFGNI